MNKIHFESVQVTLFKIIIIIHQIETTNNNTNKIYKSINNRKVL